MDICMTLQKAILLYPLKSLMQISPNSSNSLLVIFPMDVLAYIQNDV